MAIHLTPKQEKFVQEWFKTGNKKASYNTAYPNHNMSSKTVDEAACRLSKKSKVVARMEEMQEKVAKESMITVQSVTGMLNKAYDVSDNCKHGSSMVSAAMGIAKVNGLIVDTKVVVPEQANSEYIKALRERIKSNRS